MHFFSSPIPAAKRGKIELKTVLHGEELKMSQLFHCLKIQGSTRILGLLGSGISHSLSPFIHNFSAQALGMDSVYLPLDSSGKKFPERSFFQTMWDIGALGFNITVPFKEQAARMFSDSGLSSVNTLYRGESNWLATSTDAEGFVLGLQQNKLELQKFPNIILLGNGGAALALYDYFLKKTRLPIVVLRRSPDRDSHWLKPLDRVRFDQLDAKTLAEICRLEPGSLLIQTTSAPLHGDRLESLVPALDKFEGALVDLVYGKTSALLDTTRAKGLPAQDGLPMLIGQALLGQKLWWGRSAAFKDVDDALRSHLTQVQGSKKA